MPPQNLLQVREALAERYSVERELGAGGMATVYLARDLKHDRPVAIKVLRPELSAALGAERFHSEIKVTARLTHPHILALFDSGEAAGMLYYVMPYVEGESLRDRLVRDKRLPVDEALKIARAVSDALAYAHSHEVVHRDIKPENIMLQNGHALVADFGIARAVGAAGADRLTVTGLLLGTPLYMSPEQASGEVVIDGRSDVYSLACVLFEMLTGEAPFTGPTMQAVLAKRFSQPAPSAQSKNSEVPSPIDLALRKALARDPGERVESASRFADMLSAAMLTAQRVAFRDGAAAASAAPTPCIAVLPFANMSADQEAEFFSDGITEEILNALARLGGLRVIARTSSFAFKGKNTDVREIGKALGAGHILEGSVRKSGNKLRITAQLIDATTGHHLWSEKFDRDMADVFAVQDEVTAAIRDELSKHLLGIGEVKVKTAPAIDPATYELFLRGWHFVERRIEGMRRGIELLQEVTTRAPEFARGHAALAGAYSLLGFYCALPSREAFSLARTQAQRALALDPNEPMGHVLIGHAALFVDWDWPTAERCYARARHESERVPGLWSSTAGLFMEMSVGRFDIARERIQMARAADPLSPSVADTLALVEIMAGRFDSAIEVCDQILDFAPTFSEAHRKKALALLRAGHPDRALPSIEDAVRLSHRHAWSLMNQVEIYHTLGRLDDADAVIAELETRAKTASIPPYARFVGAICGSRPSADRLFDILEESMTVRDFWLVMNRVEYWPEWVTSDPRFEAMNTRIGIPPLGS